MRRDSGQALKTSNADLLARNNSVGAEVNNSDDKRDVKNEQEDDRRKQAFAYIESPSSLNVTKDLLL
jgi:hypothetical protein